MASTNDDFRKQMFWAVLIPGLVGFFGALSGGAITYFATLKLQEPKLTGSVLFVSYGETTPGEITTTVKKGVTVYAVLDNQRDATVTPMRYFLEVQTTNGRWHEYQPDAVTSDPEGPFEPFYGKMPKGLSLTFDARTLRYAGNDEWEVVFPSDASFLTSRAIGKPVKKGETVGGVLTFYLPRNLQTTDVQLRVVDANGVGYVLKKPKATFDANVLRRLEKDVEINKLPASRS